MPRQFSVEQDKTTRIRNNDENPLMSYLNRILGGGACEGAYEIIFNKINPARLGPDPLNCTYCEFYSRCSIIDAAIAQARKVAKEATSENRTSDNSASKPEEAKPQ